MASKVYFIQAKRYDEPQLVSRRAEKIFLKIGVAERIEKESFVALKIHFGERDNRGFIKSQWLLDIINHLKKKTSRVFMTDTNTLYLGRRSNSVDHLHLAWEHGFTPENIGVPVIIGDGLIGRNDDEVKVNLTRIESAKIASIFVDSDVLVCLTHCTGHALTGFGGAIKNLGMGCASRAGKLEQHSVVHPWINPKLCNNCGICLDYCPTQAIFQENGCSVIRENDCIGCGECLVVCKPGAVKMRWDSDYVRVQEKMAEYALSLHDSFQDKIGFLNFLVKVTKDCDCMAKDEPSIVEDLGILASTDPVAIDKASVDLMNKKSGRDILRVGYDVDWAVQLKYGEKIGLGSMEYELIEVA
ncbi:MAG: DUF362 domain-containing protein [Candidatus Aminicenantaceae bacterium]